jgi:septum site-determining protein MinD
MLAVTGGKGGCGKTTTALGLARTLARRGRDPLVLDADCDMPDLHHLAGIDRTEGVDALARGALLSRVCQYPDTFSGVAVVTAGRPGRTAPALRATREWDGPVLVDCPAGIGPDATRPLRQADRTLVVSTDDPQSLDDTRRTVTAARQLDAPPAGVVLRAVAERPADAPGRVAGCPVLAAIPEVPEPFEAPPLSQAWSRVADHLLEDSPGGTPGQARNDRNNTDGGQPRTGDSHSPRQRNADAGQPRTGDRRSPRQRNADGGRPGRHSSADGRHPNDRESGAARGDGGTHRGDGNRRFSSGRSAWQ